MQPDSDATLLRRYAENRDDAAFAEFVRRRIDGIYAAALRRVGGDVHLAGDVAQQVFLVIAHRPGELAAHADLTGWLFITTRHKAANIVRAERRRKAREQKAQAMHEDSAEPAHENEWSRVSPLLDDAIEQLSAVDRTAILLRFIERRGFSEIGATLRLSEDAARRRVDRALDKLRAGLARHGIVSTASALGATLANQAAVAAPANLAATVTSFALAGNASGGAAVAIGNILAMTKLKIGVLSALALGGVTLALREMRTSHELNDEIKHLQDGRAQVAGLRKANERLAATIAQTASSLPDAAEVARLHKRIAQLRARPAGVLDTEIKPVSEFANRGRATPAEAYETLFWSRTTDNRAEFAKAYGWTASGKAKVDRFFGALPKEVRENFGSPEEMLAAEDAKWGAGGAPVAVQILGQSAYGDTIMVHAWGRAAAGEEMNMDILLERSEAGWRVPFTDQMTDRRLAALDPLTGRKRVEQ